MEKKEQQEKVVCILSGGMDSTTLLYRLLDEGYDVYALTFYYGQRHSREIDCAEQTCERLGVPHEVIDIENVGKQLMQGSALTSGIDVPKGHYEDESMKKTVVPNRNMVLISLATAYAISKEAYVVAYGAHLGDHQIYPDCRQEFVNAMQDVLKVCDYKEIKLYAPYLTTDKTGILEEGKRLNVDYSTTSTCYEGQEEACGECGSCTERLESFKKLGIEDPIKYKKNG